jgi:hypothetical protein
MSGQIKEHSLEEILYCGITVVSVKIIDLSFATVPEIKKAGKNPADTTFGRFGFHKAKVNEIISGSFRLDEEDEQWTIEYAEPDKKIFMKPRKTFNIQPGDTIALFSSESINYSYIYYVQNLHKIFFYNRCNELAKKIENGKNYLFISDGSCSKKNMAFYGAIESGLINDTPENRNRIKKICKGDSNE